MAEMQQEFYQSRRQGNDTEHERQAACAKTRKQGKENEMLKDLLQQKILEQVIEEKFTQTVVEKAVEAENRAQFDKRKPEEDSDNEEDDLDAIRQKRLEQMKEKRKKIEEYKAKRHGEYEEITQDEFLPAVTGSERVVVHFYHKAFERCKIADMHLRKLTKKYIGTKFCTIDAEKAPFFVEKLGVQTLPTMVLFENGIAKHKIVGFIELGCSDEFPTLRLAKVIKDFDCIEEDVYSDEEFD